jgi:hypothetical protein
VLETVTQAACAAPASSKAAPRTLAPAASAPRKVSASILSYFKPVSAAAAASPAAAAAATPAALAGAKRAAEAAAADEAAAVKRPRPEEGQDARFLKFEPAATPPRATALRPAH